MAFPKQIRNYNVFVNGVSFFGVATEAKMPDVKISTAAHRGAGMDGPIGIDMGVEALSAEYSFAEWNKGLIGIIGTEERVTLRPVAKAEGGGEVQGYIATIGGLITGEETGNLNSGTSSPLKMMHDVRYFKLELNDEVLVEIDLENAIRVIGGVDQNAALRQAMGL